MKKSINWSIAKIRMQRDRTIRGIVSSMAKIASLSPPKLVLIFRFFFHVLWRIFNRCCWWLHHNHSMTDIYLFLLPFIPFFCKEYPAKQTSDTLQDLCHVSQLKGNYRMQFEYQKTLLASQSRLTNETIPLPVIWDLLSVRTANSCLGSVSFKNFLFTDKKIAKSGSFKIEINVFLSGYVQMLFPSKTKWICKNCFIWDGGCFRTCLSRRFGSCFWAFFFFS